MKLTNNKQKSAFWYGPGKLEVKEHPIPEVIKGSILVKIEACAICGSDLRIFNDGNPRIDPPRIIGHEISGIIAKVGDGVNDYKVGDLISIGADVPCGKCDHCNNGRSNCCDINYAIGYQFDGGFSQYMLLDPLMVKYGPIQVIKNNLSPDIVALAEPLACCINGYERSLIKPESTIVVFGGGPIGLMLCLLAPIYNKKRLILIEPSNDRLDFAKKYIDPIDIFINPNNIDPVKKIMSLTKNVGVDLIFTANPIVKTHEQAIQILAKRGVVNFFGGLPQSAKQINLLSNIIHYKEAYITGSHGSTPKQHEKALKLIIDKKINLEPLITHKFPLEKIKDAFALASSSKGLKVIVNPNV